MARALSRLVVLVVLVAVLVVAGTAARVVWVARQDDRTPADALVVLGAAQYDGRPQPYLQARLEHARELFAQEVAPRILTVGGGRPGDRFTEAEAGDRYLIDQGVPAMAVLPVNEGADTLESVQAVADVMAEHGWESAVVVTDPWHTLRTLEMFEDAGVEVRGSPTTTGPATGTVREQAAYIARETAGYLAYQWQRATS